MHISSIRSIKRKLGTEFDGDPDVYDVLVTGHTTEGSASKTGALIEKLNYTIDEIEDNTDSVQKRVGNLTGRTNDGDIAQALGLDLLPDAANGDLYSLLWKFLVNTAISTPTTKTGLQYLQAIGSNDNNNDFASNTVAANADGSVLERLEYIQANMVNDVGGLVFIGTCRSGMTGSTTTIESTDLDGHGIDLFNSKYYMQIIKNSNSAGNAPETEVRQITDYADSGGTGTFTVAPFSANAEEDDVILIMHESLVLLGRDDADNTIDTSNVVANRDGSVLERQEFIHTQLGSEFDGSPDVYDVLVTGHSTEGSASKTGAIIEKINYLLDEIEDDTDSVQKRIGNLTGRTNDGDLVQALGVDLLADAANGSVYDLFWKFMIGSAISSPTTKTGLQYLQAIGSDDGSNDFASTNVSADADGSIIEREEWLQVEMAKVPKSDSTVTWNTTALASIQAECTDAIEEDNLDHLCMLDGAAQKYPENVVDDSIIAKILVKSDPADISDYDNSTDSLEALADTLALIPQSGGTTSWNATALAAIEAECEDALEGENLDHLSKVAVDTDLATTNHDNSTIGYILAAANVSNYDRTTDSLEALGTQVADSNQQSNVTTALAADDLDHLLELDGATQKYPENCANDSIIAKMLCKGDPATISTYDCTTDSQEMLSDKLGSFTGDGGTDQNDSVKASLDLAHTDLDTIITDTNELQTDWANGGRLDVILDELTTQGDTNEGKIDTIDTVVDGIQTDLSNATDGLGALKTLIDANQADLNTIIANQGTIDTELGLIPQSGGTTTWNTTALQSIQDEAEDALEGENLDHLLATAVADTSDPVDMTTEVADDTVLSNVLTVEGDTSDYDRRDDSLQAIGDRITAYSSDLILHQVFATGACGNAGEVTCIALDALSGPVKDIKATIYTDAATADNITPIWYMTSINAPETFVAALSPAPGAQNPAAAAFIGAYEFGDVAEGLQLELRLDSTGNDAGVNYYVELTYIGEL